MDEPRNAAVLLVHTTEELTTATIVTCPPAGPPAPLDRLLDVPGVRSLDLHRYRVRVNLSPQAERRAVRRGVERLLTPAWGRPVPLPPEPGPRELPVPHDGPRLVAESPEMAGGDPILRAAFHVPGVVEAIVDRGVVQIRLGRLFSWEEILGSLQRALVDPPAEEATGP